MQRSNISRWRLTGVAAMACAAALIPVAALAATASPARAAASTPACSTSGLVVWLNTQGNPGMSQDYYALNFTNLSGHACTLHGHPGVSAANLGGRQIGAPARWQTGRQPVVRLASGATATATLNIENVGAYAPSCHPVTAAGLRVYPPNQTTSKIIPYPFGTCSSTGTDNLVIQAVQK
jgi:hypothetical protein